MSSKSTIARRALVVAWPVALSTTILAACGSDGDAGPSRTTINLTEESTAFVVRPPVTTTTAPEIEVEPGIVAGSQEYVVQIGDYPYKIVEMFGVPLEDLLAFNGWASVGEFPLPGNTIGIPPGAKAQGSTDTASGDTASGDGSGDTASGDSTPAAGDTIPDAGDNCAAGTHTIVDGDYEGKVAAQYDVTVDALRAANASTSGYSAFYPGLEIVIPAKDC